jgi:hypothetical protein
MDEEGLINARARGEKIDRLIFYLSQKCELGKKINGRREVIDCVVGVRLKRNYSTWIVIGGSRLAARGRGPRRRSGPHAEGGDKASTR